MFGSERVTSTSFAESYGVSCIAMMNIAERTAEDEIYHYTLLFAGLNNGHITLVYSNGKSHDSILLNVTVCILYVFCIYSSVRAMHVTPCNFSCTLRGNYVNQM